MKNLIVDILAEVDGLTWGSTRNTIIVKENIATIFNCRSQDLI